MKFYIQMVGDHRIAFIQQQVSSLEVNDPPETLDAEDHLSKSLEGEGEGEVLSETSKSLEGEGEALSETFEVEDPSENLEAEVPLDTLEVKDPFESLEAEVPLGTLEVNGPSDAAPFNPMKGDVVLARFSLNNSWNRAMVR